MNLLFLSYWGLNEGLTQATIIPHLKILSQMPAVSSIQFITIERHGLVKPLKMPRVDHFQIETNTSLKKKLFDKSKTRQLMNHLQNSQPIDFILARGVFAGWIAHAFASKHQIPFSVESFEPHSRYMVEDGIWKQRGAKYMTLSRAEQRLKQQADYILPVSERYAKALVGEGVSQDKILTMPCCVDPQQFAFSIEARKEVRQRHRIPEEAVVGIYTGKLGGIYLKEECMELFKLGEAHFQQRFHMILLTPDIEQWRALLVESGFNLDQFTILRVAHDEVPAYLSAAEYAYSLHRPTKAKMAISPIKNAEYWANGLHIIMTDGIGDDSNETRANKLGLVLDDPNEIPKHLFAQLEKLWPTDRTKNECVAFAKNNRSFDIVRGHYQHMLQNAKSKR